MNIIIISFELMFVLPKKALKCCIHTHTYIHIAIHLYTYVYIAFYLERRQTEKLYSYILISINKITILKGSNKNI